jgi:hypothetical protein
MRARATTIGAWVVLGSWLAAGVPARAQSRVSRIDNGVVRLGVDLDLGGSITEFGRAGDSPNLINSHDYGRQVQQSYYGGPVPYGEAHPNWKNWPWNPIGTGDVYGNPSRLVEHENDGKTLYVKSVPKQWALKDVPGECTFETWVTLDGPVATIRNRLANARPDATFYGAFNQELPAVYTVGTLHRLFTYKGTRPWAGEPAEQVRNAGPPWADWTAPEGWAALVDDRGRGVGVIHPGVYSWIGGFHDRPGRGGPKDNPTGYIAPTRREILDHNIRYEFTYRLMLGTLEEIRATAKALRPADTRPDHHFKADRQHWTYHNAKDAGFPPTDGLRVRPTGDDPQMLGPESWYDAATAPALNLRAAFRTKPGRIALYWRGPGEGFAADRVVTVPVEADGALRTVTIDLAAHPKYRGTIAALRLDPFPADDPDGEVRIESLSWKKE